MCFSFPFFNFLFPNSNFKYKFLYTNANEVSFYKLYLFTKQNKCYKTNIICLRWFVLQYYVHLRCSCTSWRLKLGDFAGSKTDVKTKTFFFSSVPNHFSVLRCIMFHILPILFARLAWFGRTTNRYNESRVILW